MPATLTFALQVAYSRKLIEFLNRAVAGRVGEVSRRLGRNRPRLSDSRTSLRATYVGTPSCIRGLTSVPCSADVSNARTAVPNGTSIDKPCREIKMRASYPSRQRIALPRSRSA